MSDNTLSVPAEQTSGGILSAAIDAIVNNKEVTPEFIAQLKLVTSKSEKKWNLIDTLLANHQMNRLSKLFRIIDPIEDKFVAALSGEDSDGEGSNDAKLFRTFLNTSPELALEVLKIMYKEASAAREYVESRKQKVAEPDDVLDREKDVEEQALADQIKKLPKNERALISKALLLLRHQGQAELENTPPPSEEQAS